MERDPFVEYSKNKLEGLRTEINGEDIWSNIKDQVQTKKKKKKRFWWFFTLASISFLILTAIGFIFIDGYVYQKNSLIAKDQNDNIEEKIIHQVRSQDASITQLQGDQVDTMFDDYKRSHKLSKPMDFSLQKNEGTKNLNPMNNSDQIIELTKEFNQPQSTYSNAIQTNRIGFSINHILNDENKKPKNTNTQKSKVKENQFYIDHLPRIDLTEVGIKGLNPFGLRINDKHLSLRSIEENTNNQKSLGLKFSIYGGMLRFNTQLSSINSEYLTKRKQTEKDLTSLRFGFNLNKEISHGFYVTCGLEYINKRSQFNFNGDIITLDSIEQPVLIIINPFTGVTENHFGKSLETTTTTYNKSISNEIHFLNIPFGIGYNYNIGNWNFGIEPGITVNLLTKYKGQIFNEDLSGFYYLENDNNDFFANRTNLVFKGDFHLGYQISNSLEIYSVFSYYDQTSVSNESNVIDESFGGFGISSGMRFNL